MLGKTFQQVAWANTVPGRVLILAPLCVAEQTVAEGVKLGIPVHYARGQATAEGHRIVITNYEMLDRFDVSQFAGVVLDECFAPGTAVDVLSLDGTPERKYIQDIHVGETILNASGVDLVSAVHRRAVPYAVKVTIAGQAIVCSPNHPWFTREGWLGAVDLQPGAEVMATAEAVRVVQEPLHAALLAAGDETILQHILLSEMADVSAGDSGEGARAIRPQESWPRDSCVVSRGQSESQAPNRADSRLESHERSGGASQSLAHAASHASWPVSSWRQWQGHDKTAAIALGGSWLELATGIRSESWPAHARLSYLLQDRSCRTRLENRHRGGWVLPSQPEATGREEGRQAAFTRVDRLEILEPGHPELERWRDADGSVYFYDLGATRHPSFSVSGHLVHNSSILKSYDGKTRTALINTFARTPYRLCCTATPSPNDIAELANHAEFLGIQTRAEFLATWFVHDDQGWRMKRHARQPFFRWLASWAVAFRKPSDLGYDDTGFILPALTIRDHVIESQSVAGALFPELGSRGLKGRLAARRGSLSARVDAVQAIVDEYDTWLVWTGLNEESDTLVQLLPHSVNVQGSDHYEKKVRAVMGFQHGEFPIMISKLSIIGFGLNLQHCARMVFCGLSDSYESYYQGLRRCWRFGQKRAVEATIIVSDAERVVVENVRRKEARANVLATELLSAMRDFEREEIAV